VGGYDEGSLQGFRCGQAPWPTAFSGPPDASKSKVPCVRFYQNKIVTIDITDVRKVEVGSPPLEAYEGALQ
jgi:hypothetical protein